MAFWKRKEEGEPRKEPESPRSADINFLGLDLKIIENRCPTSHLTPGDVHYTVAFPDQAVTQEQLVYLSNTLPRVLKHDQKISFSAVSASVGHLKIVQNGLAAPAPGTDKDANLLTLKQAFNEFGQKQRFKSVENLAKHMRYEQLVEQAGSERAEGTAIARALRPEKLASEVATTALIHALIERGMLNSSDINELNRIRGVVVDEIMIRRMEAVRERNGGI